jgi:hypothetical protein
MFRLAILLSTLQLLFLQTDALASSLGWRVALNIGNEGGARLPVVIRCDFLPNGQVVPKEDVIRFTGPDGEVVKPIEQGKWSLKDERELEFSFTFPEKLSRRDVEFGPGKLQCKSLLYSKDAIKEMNDVFYRTREEVWAAGKLVNDITLRAEAPKKWDEQKGWVTRYETEGFMSQINKQVGLFNAKRNQKKDNSKRPNPKVLSLDSGPFPGVKSDVFIKELGVVTGPRGGVVGTWSAEPITYAAKSYY